MSCFSTINKKFKEYIFKIQNANKEDLIYKTFPKIGGVSYLVYSSKFLAPDLFSK